MWGQGGGRGGQGKRGGTGAARAGGGRGSHASEGKRWGQSKGTRRALPLPPHLLVPACFADRNGVKCMPDPLPRCPCLPPPRPCRPLLVPARHPPPPPLPRLCPSPLTVMECCTCLLLVPLVPCSWAPVHAPPRCPCCPHPSRSLPHTSLGASRPPPPPLLLLVPLTPSLSRPLLPPLASQVGGVPRRACRIIAEMTSCHQEEREEGGQKGAARGRHPGGRKERAGGSHEGGPRVLRLCFFFHFIRDRLARPGKKQNKEAWLSQKDEVTKMRKEEKETQDWQDC